MVQILSGALRHNHLLCADSRQQSTGIVRFYTSRTGKTTFPEGEEAAAREIMRLFPDRFFELVDCTPKRSVIKKLPEDAVALALAFVACRGR